MKYPKLCGCLPGKSGNLDAAKEGEEVIEELKPQTRPQTSTNPSELPIMASKKIVIFLGSTRNGRMCERVAKVVEKAVEAKGMEPVIFDPLHMPFEMLQQPLHFYPNPDDAPTWLKEASQKIATADGFLIVSAEYNWGVPPALSNMMDHFPPPAFAHRPLGIVTYSMGPFGGSTAGVLLRPFASILGTLVIPSFVPIPTVQNAIDADGTVKDERITKNMTKLVDTLEWYANAFNNQKAIIPPPGFGLPA